jgi:hypothetical protein
MANPYDFTSGYFQSRSLAEQRQQAEDIKKIREATLAETTADRQQKYAIMAPLYEAQASNYRAMSPLYAAQARNYNESANALGIKNKQEIRMNDLLVNPAVDRAARSMGLGIKTPATSLNISSITNGWDSGFQKPDYRMVAGGVAADEEEVPKFNNGTPGGLKIGNGMSMVTDLEKDTAISLEPKADMNVAQAAPQQVNPEQSNSGLEALNKRDPNAAESVTRNIFGMSPREFQKLSGALALADFGRGKITSSDLTNHVEGLRKIQSEGVLRAHNAVLAGNEKEGIAIYNDFGDDRQSVVGMKKIQIANPIASALNKPKGQKTMDTYDAVLVTMKDGSTVTLDGRRLSADIVGTAKAMEHDEKIAGSLRTQETSDQNARLQAEANRNQRDALKQQNDARMDAKNAEIDRSYMALASSQFDKEYSMQAKKLVDQNNIDNKLDEPKLKAALENLQINLRPALDLATMNIAVVGNRKVTFQSALAAMNNPKPALDKDGQPIIKEINGQVFGQTYNGVFIPLSPREAGAESPPPGNSPAPSAPLVIQPQQAIPTPSSPGSNLRIPPVTSKIVMGQRRYIIDGVMGSSDTEEEAKNAFIKKYQKLVK